MCENTKKQLEILKIKLTAAYNDAKKAYELVSKDTKIALMFLTKAHSTISSCESIYYSNYLELKDKRFEDIFVCFCVFSNQMVTDITTNHLTQQTSIDFNKLKDSFKLLIDIE